jgi:hypothetical protein
VPVARLTEDSRFKWGAACIGGRPRSQCYLLCHLRVGFKTTVPGVRHRGSRAMLQSVRRFDPFAVMISQSKCSAGLVRFACAAFPTEGRRKKRRRCSTHSASSSTISRPQSLFRRGRFCGRSDRSLFRRPPFRRPQVGIMIRTQIFWGRLPSNRTIEHATK